MVKRESIMRYYRRRARKKFQEYHGVTLSEDMRVHHIDGDYTNNEIWNLQAMQDRDHKRHHNLIYDKYYEEIQELYDKGYNDLQIARELVIQRMPVRTWRYNLELPSNFTLLRKSRLDEIQKLYDEGCSDRKIAREIGFDKKNVYNWRLERGLSSNWLRTNL